MSDSGELKRCGRCSAWMPSVATMCATCGTTDVDGAPAAQPKPGRAPAQMGARVRVGWSVTRILIWMNALYLLWCLRVQFAFTPDASAFQALISPNGLGNGLLSTGAYDAARVANGEWWRAFTAFFLHAGVFHIGMNMWVLSRVGDLLEDLIGPWRFATIYLVSGLCSTLAITVWFRWITNEPGAHMMVGASGAVFGVLGALAMFARRSGTGRGQQLGKLLMRDIFFMLVIGWIIPMVSNTGHIGGLLPGLAFGLLVGERFTDRIAPAGQRVWMAVTLILTGATGVALAHGINYSLKVMEHLR